jgi:SAM-dependent methyltransferase
MPVTEAPPDKIVINRQRLTPRVWHFSFLLLRNNIRAFATFAAELRSQGSNTSIRVLDVGCGNKPWRPLLQKLLQQDSNLEYYGTDFSINASEPDALSLADALPFPDNCFDAVILSEVLEHCPFPAQVIQECRRVLKPGSLVFASTPFVFYEHGVPYDFQRPTRFFYRTHFVGDEIILLSPSNSTYSTAITTLNLAIETTPLRLLPVFPGVVYSITNFLVRAIGPRIMRTWQDVFFSMPLGFATVLRIRKKSQ